MKTPLLLICTSFFLLPLTADAQNDTASSQQVRSDTARPQAGFKRWNITASFGYGWPTVKSVIGHESFVGDQNQILQRPVRGSLGAGIFNALTAGYAATKNIGFEIGMFAGWGTKTQTTDLFYLADSRKDERFMRVNTKGLLFGLCISETFSKARISIHNNFVWGLSQQLFYQVHTENPTIAVDSDWQYYGGMSYGWMGKVSASYFLAEPIEIGVESFFMLHSWTPDKGKSGTTTFTDNYNSYTEASSPPAGERETAYPLNAAGGNIFFRYSF
jgi:hypothetical protein